MPADAARFIDVVTVYLATDSLPEDCPRDELLDATVESLRSTQRFGVLDVHRGPEPPSGHHVAIRIGTMKTVVGEMPMVELTLIDAAGAVVEATEPYGSKKDLLRVAAELALQFADEELYPALMAARGHTGKCEHPRVRYFDERDATIMGAALLMNVSNAVARGQDLRGMPTPPTVERLCVVGARSGSAAALALAAEILSLWGDASAVLALLQKGHDALPIDKRPALARRLHGATRQSRNGAELASMLIHLGALPGGLTEDNLPRHAVMRWLSITGILLGTPKAELKDTLGAAWARLPTLGIALAKPAPDESFRSLLNACRPALPPLDAANELRALADADAASWRAAADVFLERAARAAPLLAVEPWQRYAAIGRAGAPEARGMLQRAIALAPRVGFLHEMLGLEHMCVGEFDRAIAELTKAIDLQSDSANGHNLRGAALSDQATRLEDAMDDLDRAIELDASVALAWSNRAKTRLRLSQPEEALQDIDHALRLAPGHEDSTAFRMTLLLELGRHDDVVAAGDAFLGGRLSATILIKRGTAKLHLGDHAGALADLDAGIALTPFEDGFFFRGQVHLATGALDAAERDFRLILKGNVAEPRRGECASFLAEIDARRTPASASKESRSWWKKLWE